VEEMDRAHGTAWRKKSSLKQFYSLRKTIIEEVKRRAGAGSERRAVEDLDRERVMEGNKSLDWLAKEIRKKR